MNVGKKVFSILLIKHMKTAEYDIMFKGYFVL